MLKLASAMAVAFLFLLAEIVTANPEAAALSGIMGAKPGTTHALIQNAACDKDAIDSCPQGKEIVCKEGADCACLECNAGGHAVCPNAAICAPRGTCKVCLNGFKCCLM